MPARMQPARAGLAWMQPNFMVLRKVSACVDDRHLKIMAEFDLGEPNFEVLRKVSACDDDRHFSKTLQFPHAFKGHSPAIRAPYSFPAFLGLSSRRNGDFEGLRST